MTYAQRLRKLADSTGLDAFGDEIRAIADEMDAQPADVTDEQINAVALEQWGPHAGGPLAAHRAFARAILALRPERVPMTEGTARQFVEWMKAQPDDRVPTTIDGALAEFEAHHGITAQATQATPSIPSDGPSTYEQRFTAAVAVICGVTPPAALVCDWINKAERHDDLQQWVGSYAPGWVQNIAVLDAAHQMADQPTEGGNHEPAQQPDNAACKSVQKRLAAQQPATPESVQADSSEHLRVVASLGDALRRLSFAAQTTGGTAGPDAELQSAIGQAEQALSLGGIWQAMSATPEPVWCVATGERVNGEETYTHHDAYVPLADCFPLYTHQAPSVPKDDQIAALVNKVRDIARMFHDHQSLRERIAIELVPALKASQEVKSNAERWRYAIADSGNQTMNFIDIFDDWNGDGSFVEAFDKARLADKKEGSAA